MIFSVNVEPSYRILILSSFYTHVSWCNHCIIIFLSRVLEEVNFEDKFRQLPEYHPEEHLAERNVIPLTPEAIVSSYRRKRKGSTSKSDLPHRDASPRRQNWRFKMSFQYINCGVLVPGRPLDYIAVHTRDHRFFKPPLNEFVHWWKLHPIRGFSHAFLWMSTPKRGFSRAFLRMI